MALLLPGKEDTLDPRALLSLWLAIVNGLKAASFQFTEAS